MKNDLGFIFNHWSAINLAILFLTIISIVLIILSDEKIKMKVVFIFIVSFLPLVGIFLYFGRIIFRYRKKKK
jgi:hypothetical protein